MSQKQSISAVALSWGLPAVCKHWLLCRLLVGTLALACYSNSIWGDFVFDDSEAIIRNKDVNPETPLTDVFTNDFWGKKITLNTSHKSYRPLTIITFRWNFWLAGGLEPYGFHLTNVVLHVFVSVLFMEVCCCLVEDWAWGGRQRGRDVSPCSLFAAVLFAVHPVHTENVAGIVGRAELTSAICFFSAFLCYARSCRSADNVFLSVVWILLTSVLAGCAMLFKEQGITVMGVCIVYDVFVYTKVEPLYPFASSKPNWKTLILRLTMVISSTVLLVAARFLLMATGPPGFMPTDNPASFADSVITRVLSYHYIYSLNAWLLLNPWWLCFDWSMGCVPLVESPVDVRLMAAVIFWCGLGALGVYALVGKPGQFRRMVAISLALLVIPFVPASNLFLRVGFVVAERVLYVPSAGHCLLVALGLSTLAHHYRRLQPVLLLSLMVLVFLFVSRSIQRSSEWLTEESLFISGAAVCPKNAKVHYNVGKVMADSGRTIEAETAYTEAIRLFPEYDQALNNLGNLYKETERPQEAEEMFNRALKANSEFAAAWMNLGIVQAALNKTKEAETSYKTAIKHRNKYPDAYYNLGNMYIDIGRYTDAIAAFKAAIALQEDHTNSWNNLCLLYENLHMYVEAESTMREAMEIMPSQSQFYFSLGVMLGRLERLQEAEKLLLTSISMDPSISKYHANLGVVYHLKKEYIKAEEEYRYALNMDPDLAIAKDNLQKLMKTRKKCVSK